MNFDQVSPVQIVKVGRFEQLDAAVPAGSISPRFLSGRTPSGTLGMALLGESKLSMGNVDADFLARGILSEDKMTLGLGIEGEGTQVAGVESKPGDLLLSPANAEHIAVHRRHLKFIMITTCPQRFRQLAEAEGLELSEELLSKPGIYRPSQKMARFNADFGRSLTDSVFSGNERSAHDQSLKADALRNYTSDEVLQFFLRAFAHRDLVVPETSSYVRMGKDIIKNAEFFLEQQKDRVLSISELAVLLAISERQFFRVCRSYLGLSPAQYLKRYRLSRVFRDLGQGTESETNVTSIALKWGFLNRGRFAAEYRRFFGEYPLESLKRHPSSKTFPAFGGLYPVDAGLLH